MKIKIAARQVRACSMLMLGVAGATASGPVWAQASPAPTPTPSPTPALVPGLEHFSLQPSTGSRVTRPATPPTLAPPVVRTLPAPTPTPTRSQRPAAPTPTPSPAATPAPARTQSPQPLAPAPTALPTPLQTATPTGAPTPIPTATPTAEPLPPVVLPPIPEPTGEPSPVAPDLDHGYRLQGWQAYAAIGGGAATLFLLGWLTFVWLRRREEVVDAPAPERRSHTVFDLGAADAAPALPPRSAVPEAPPQTPLPPVPSPPPPSPPPPSPVSAPSPAVSAQPATESPAPVAQEVSARARLDIELKPKRAGTNLLSAAVEYQIQVTNAGDAPARLVTTDVRILTAGAEQDAILQQFFAAPIEKPVAAPFAVAPGESATLDGMVMIPKEKLNVMTVGDRKLFVPVLAINLRYEWEGGSGQTATSHVIGINRGEGAKLAPFRLDGASRMRDDVSQIPYTVSTRR